MSVANELPFSFCPTPNGVSIVTKWLSTGIWAGCSDPVVTTWTECVPQIVPPVMAVQEITFSSAPVAGSFVLSFDGTDTAPILYGSLAFAPFFDIQTPLRLIPTLSAVAQLQTATTLTLYFQPGDLGPVPLLEVKSNLTGVTMTVASLVDGEFASGPGTTVWTPFS